MITRPTVFVLGAGASYPYGFPTGEGLVNDIITLASRTQTPDAFLYNDCTEKDVKRFAQDLADSDPPSVDAFLEHRPDFLRIGKLAICLSLIPKERDVTLTRDYRQGSSLGKTCWYQYLWNLMAAEKGGFGKNQVSFVTMNYDRSLERYFFLRLKAKHQYADDDQCFEELYQLRFVHVYGSLGDERFVEDSFNRLTPSISDVRRSSNRLRIIHEETTEAPYLTEATKLLTGAEVMCFLGYGFHRLNNERLGLLGLAREDQEHDSRGDKSRRWFASRYGITNVEFNRITTGFRARFSGYGQPLEYAGNETDGALEVLRKLPIIP